MSIERIFPVLVSGLPLALLLVACGPSGAQGLQPYVGGLLAANLTDTDVPGQKTQLLVELQGEGPCDGAPEAEIRFNGETLDRLGEKSANAALDDDACPPLRGVGPVIPDHFPETGDEVESGPALIEIVEGDDKVEASFTNLAVRRRVFMTVPLTSAAPGSSVDFSWRPLHETLVGASALMRGADGEKTLAMQAGNGLLTAILPGDVEAGDYELEITGQVDLSAGDCQNASACTGQYVLTRVFPLEILP
jgi:hypothetical protein